MLSRPATHAGSWYSGDKNSLARRVGQFFHKAPPTKNGARVILAPHAGYTYCGQQLAEAYKAWDCRGAKRVFILGPSHHVYFQDKALLSPFESYETPLGDVPVDRATCEELVSVSVPESTHVLPFEYMSQGVDEDEHSFEMHLPFLVHKCHEANQDIPPIIPVMISGLSVRARRHVVLVLSPYFKDPTNTFVILSDFCHWGRRFGYTRYVPETELSLICEYKGAASQKTPIYESIEYLDRLAMVVASAGSVAKWDEYIAATGNTICGQKPIAIILLLLEELQGVKSAGTAPSFHWIGYSQSNKVVSVSDHSVSYASGYVVLE